MSISLAAGQPLFGTVFWCHEEKVFPFLMIQFFFLWQFSSRELVRLNSILQVWDNLSQGLEGGLFSAKSQPGLVCMRKSLVFMVWERVGSCGRYGSMEMFDQLFILLNSPSR
jgi:hypothetical protein